MNAPLPLWPMSRLAEGLEVLARAAGIAVADAPAATLVPDPVQRAQVDALERWLPWAGAVRGIDVEPLDATVPDALQLLQGAAPAVCFVRGADGPGFVLLLSARRGRLALIAPDLQRVRCEAESLRAALCAGRERPLVPEIDRLLSLAGVPAARRDKARAAMLRERLAAERVDGLWMLRSRAASALPRQFADAGLGRRLGAMLGVFAAVYLLEIGGWALIGSAALDGRLDPGWLAAWVLALMSAVPLRTLGGWLQGTLALDAGRILKRRVMAGALAIDADAMRSEGAGRLLGRVLESQVLESSAIGGALAVMVGLLELAFAGWVLAQGAAPALHLPLLLGWLLLTAALGTRFWQRLRRWTGARLEITHELVERMVGHRTRLAQEAPRRRDAHDDRRIGDYLQVSRGLDRAVLPLGVATSAGWLLVALMALAPAFVASTGPAALAVSLGGLLFAMRAFGAIGGGVAALSSAAIAWREVAPMLRAGAQPGRPGLYQPPARVTPPASMHAAAGSAPAGVRRAPLVDASALTFRHAGQQAPVLDGASLRIDRGERLLLEGPSGGGKSTLGALLTGLRTPERGLLLLDGLDRPTLGDGWHALVAAAPQFHENHVLGGSLAFNLLMGRDWPARESDLREARELCERLGLGPLLARMPAGLMQRVGETGWQLSHGERSRIFLARALLQKAPLTILDESFAALDPQTLQTCLETARAEADALLVVAHP